MEDMAVLGQENGSYCIPSLAGKGRVCSSCTYSVTAGPYVKLAMLLPEGIDSCY